MQYFQIILQTVETILAGYSTSRLFYRRQKLFQQVYSTSRSFYRRQNFSSRYTVLLDHSTDGKTILAGIQYVQIILKKVKNCPDRSKIKYIQIRRQVETSFLNCLQLTTNFCTSEIKCNERHLQQIDYFLYSFFPLLPSV